MKFPAKLNKMHACILIHKRDILHHESQTEMEVETYISEEENVTKIPIIVFPIVEQLSVLRVKI